MLASTRGAIALRPSARWGGAARLRLLLPRRAPRVGPLLRPLVVPGDQASRLLLLPPGAATRRSGGGGGGGGAARRNSGSGRASPPPSSLGSEHQQHHQQHQHQQHQQHHHQQSVNEGDEDDQDDPVAYWGYWGDGQASSLAAAEAAADEATAAAAAAAEATSTALSSSAGAARLVASLPASAMFETAFFSADRDGDGRLTRDEAALLLFYVTATSGDGAREAASAARRRAREAVAEAQAVAAATTAAAASSSSTSTAAPQPRTWDEHLVADWRRAALASRGGVPAAALRFAARALAGRAHEQSSWGGGSDDEKAGARQAPSAPPHPTTRAAAAPPLLSDILWSALFAGAAVAALGAFAAAARSLPLVGAWHQQQGASSAALPLLLSSFGALCVLLFARPESEAVRVWNVVAGQLAGTALAIACLTLLGPGLWARAVGMAAVVGFMLWADCAHPPGGALALFAMDYAPALLPSGAGWAFCLWPSLTLTLGVLMPLGWLCNHMKRTARFGWPGGVAAAGSLGEGRGAAESSPLPAARPASPLPLPVVEVAGAAAAAPYDPAPLRRRYHVRSSDGGGWIDDMT